MQRWQVGNVCYHSKGGCDQQFLRFLIFVFFGICLLLGYLQKSQHEQVSNFSNIEETSEQASEAPVVNTDAPVVNTDAPAVTESKTDAPATK